MHQYLFRRLLVLVPELIGVSLIVFIVMRVVPGDVALNILMGSGGQGQATERDLQLLRQKLGTDLPLHEQYLRWIGGLPRLDAGDSFKSGRPVTQEIGARLPVTAELAFFTMIVSMLIAVPAGVVSAVRQDTALDYVFRVFAIGGLAVPVLWSGTLIVLVLTLGFRWLPPLGFANLFADPLRNIQQILLPSVALGYTFAAGVARMTRSQMLEVLRQDYVRTAWSKGLRERTVVFRHALKNALLPVVTLAGLQFGQLMGGAVIVENIFVLPGLGSALVESITFRDYPMVQAIVLLIALWYSLINLVIDVVYGWLDPRIRYT